MDFYLYFVQIISNSWPLAFLFRILITTSDQSTTLSLWYCYCRLIFKFLQYPTVMKHKSTLSGICTQKTQRAKKKPCLRIFYVNSLVDKKHYDSVMCNQWECVERSFYLKFMATGLTRVASQIWKLNPRSFPGVFQEFFINFPGVLLVLQALLHQNNWGGLKIFLW